ncbi:MAG: hypothetical protein JWO67_2296 [Streptosporangiaceae bacterium]|nr:hypothetical protein [Streptosporangiaceae bacterium]
MNAQVAADLRAAADVLRRDGWTQGSYHGPGGCHCALGALVVATTGEELDPDEDPEVWSVRYSGAVEVLEKYTKRHTPQWNDAPGRTADEVIAALLAAADAAEASS